MAVFTRITHEELTQWLKHFACGELLSFEGISSGIENTNYFVNTSQGRYVLTLFEKLTTNEVPFYLALMQHLASQNLPVACPVLTTNKQLFLNFKNKPAALVACLPGQSIEKPNAQQCHAIGQFAAQAHLAVKTFKGDLQNPRDLTWITEAANKLKPCVPQATYHLLTEEISFQQDVANSPAYKTLPQGVVHADLFRDNALLEANSLGGVIDFYFAGIDTFLYDLCVIANDWCIQHKTGEFEINLLIALTQSYNQARPFTEQEQQLWPAQLRLAALRFWTSRLYDYFLPRDADMLTAKNPEHFQNVLVQRQHIELTPSLSSLCQTGKPL